MRQLWVRLQVVLGDPESPLCLAIARVQRAEAAEAQLTDIDDALAMVGGG